MITFALPHAHHVLDLSKLFHWKLIQLWCNCEINYQLGGLRT